MAGQDLRGELGPKGSRERTESKVPKESWDHLEEVENKESWDHQELRGEKGTKGEIGPPGIPGIPGIKGEPGESISEPIVTISHSQLTVNETNTATLLYSASGNPAARISWSKVNGSLPSNKTKVTSDGLMQIFDARLEDAGKYKCVSRNILGKDEKVSSLIIQSR